MAGLFCLTPEPIRDWLGVSFSLVSPNQMFPSPYSSSASSSNVPSVRIGDLEDNGIGLHLI
ncbi:UNVERIFIED_CONTAM: hypothetical protein Sradi_7199100 [Sesamum radiatum]|uniref:Uncharacterized protein n=1 Tax=Sesamum radiatum TaxID=300843 RepID=A0AAW2IQH7_SESRA